MWSWVLRVCNSGNSSTSDWRSDPASLDEEIDELRNETLGVVDEKLDDIEVEEHDPENDPPNFFLLGTDRRLADLAESLERVPGGLLTPRSWACSKVAESRLHIPDSMLDDFFSSALDPELVETPTDTIEGLRMEPRGRVLTSPLVG
jgi:hypothetical protein